MSNVMYQPFITLTDDDGLPIVGALAYFYLIGSTTPEAIYADYAITTPVAQPITTDINGRFPVVFFDPHQTYRMKVILPGGDLAHPLLDVDPVAVEQSALTNVDVESALGYVPTNPASAVFTGPARLAFSPAPVALEVDDVGFRGIPPSIHDANYVIALNDSGSVLVKDDTSAPSWTLNSAVMPLGHWFDVLNVNTGNVSVNAIGNVTLQVMGNLTVGTSANVTEGGGGKFHQYETDKWIIKGGEGVTVS